MLLNTVQQRRGGAEEDGRNRLETESQRKRREAARRLLDLAAELGNVSEACRRLGIDRAAYYRIMKVTGGGDPSGEIPRRSNSVPMEAEDRILRLCLENPEWGCDRIACYLGLKGCAVSSPTVQKVLIRNGLGRKAQRMAEKARRDAVQGEAS
jgi:hypothetical protein